jgi:signal transduction histidine kinase
MAILGNWVTTQITASALKSAAISSSVFMEIFLEPNVQDLAEGEVVTPQISDRLDAILVDTPLSNRLVSVKLWSKDGTIQYSTHKDQVGEKIPSEDVARAARGETIASYDHLDDLEAAREHATGLPLLEVYAPLRRRGSDEIIAVGEYYENAPWFGEQLRNAQATTWLVVAVTTMAMLSVLFLIVRRGSTTIALQRRQLRRRMIRASQLAKQNEHLRDAADKARLDANEANEQLLARIGSDLHDGPIQLISLLMLKLSSGEAAANDRTTGSASLVQITNNVLSELRNLSAGLSLPEISTLSLTQALQLAVFRHEDMSGTKVASDIPDLPRDVSPAIKICAYRIIQEALNNAYKHARGAPVAVKVWVEDSHLHITVVDHGPGIGAEGKVVDRQKLGIAGIRNRVIILKGSVEIGSFGGAGTQLKVQLPLQS